MNNKFENEINATCKKLANLLIEKNKMYGDSFKDTYRKYGNTVLLIRLEDKIQRLYTLLMKKENNSAESVKDNFIDLAGYAILSYCTIDE